jgi:hypothetical protein
MDPIEGRLAMERLIAYCGLDCAACNAYLATKANDAALIERTAAEWSEMYHSNVTAKDVWCDGCTTQAGRLFGHCAECNIRACALAHQVANCGVCSEYCCDTVASFLEMAPDLKSVLDKIHAAK